MSKPPLLLLHGALGTQAQFAELMPRLDDQFQIHLLNFEGHGDRPLTKDTFKIEYFAGNVLAYLAEKSLLEINIFGYSMGGYVALFLAKTNPDRIKQVFTLATKFAWTPEVAAREIKLLDADKIAEKLPHFAQTLTERHPALGWRNVLQQTQAMMVGLGEQPSLAAEEIKQLAQPIRIGLGDRDSTVSLEESLELYRLLPQGELEVFPATPHPFEKVSPTRLAHSLLDFFK